MYLIFFSSWFKVNLKNQRPSEIQTTGWLTVLCPQASHTHDAIAEAAQLMKEAVDDIMVTLNDAASEVGMVGGMVDSIAEAMGKVSCGGVCVSVCGKGGASQP